MPTALFVDWINRADPEHPLSMDEARKYPNVFLIPVSTDYSEPDTEKWLRRNWPTVFDSMLEDRYIDKSLWPANRSLKLFREWGDIRIHSTIFDSTNEPIRHQA